MSKPKEKHNVREATSSPEENIDVRVLDKKPNTNKNESFTNSLTIKVIVRQ